jgi:hypothetical protein
MLVHFIQFHHAQYSSQNRKRSDFFLIQEEARLRPNGAKVASNSKMSKIGQGPSLALEGYKWPPVCT